MQVREIACPIRRWSTYGNFLTCGFVARTSLLPLIASSESSSGWRKRNNKPRSMTAHTNSPNKNNRRLIYLTASDACGKTVSKDRLVLWNVFFYVEVPLTFIPYSNFKRDVMFPILYSVGTTRHQPLPRLPRFFLYRVCDICHNSIEDSDSC